MPSHANQKEVPFQERFLAFAGFDWASDHHDLVLLNGTGKLLMELTFADDAEGWRDLSQRLSRGLGLDPGRLGVAVETNNGPAVERLLALGCVVYPLNPKAAQRYRERKSNAGCKDDRLDALSFADALRTDGHAWRPLTPDDPLTQELRLLCRDEIQLIGHRTALVNQLRAALREYYPAALEAFDNWVSEAAWAFVQSFPTPQDLVAAGKRKWERFLHAHKLYRPETYAKRLEIFARADQFCGRAPVTRAKSRLALTLAGQLRLLEKQLTQYRQSIEALFAQHPDHDIFGSLPGAGPKIGPRLLGELGNDPARFQTHQSLQCYGGSAPVTKQLGKNRYVSFRRACNKTLRATLHYWADKSREQCAWAQAYYQHKRQHGQSHAAALRCLAQRWVKILWKMWQTHTCYDEALHTRNQVKHGSWVTKPAEGAIC
jgi:transposase